MSSPHGPPMTADDLIEHRLKTLEDIAVGARETERRVDALALTVAAIERTVTETQAEMRSRDEHARASLARLHARLDEIVHAEARQAGRDEGRAEARTTTWKVVAWTVGACLGVGGLVVGVLTLVLA